MTLVLHDGPADGRPQPAADVSGRFRAAMVRGLAWPAAVWRRRRLLGLMARMSDHELRDIGLRWTDLADAAAVPLDQDASAFLQARRCGRQRGPSRSPRR